MANEKKGVTVEAIHGTMQEPRHHAEATSIKVEDGHLHVSKSGGANSFGPETIAIYAPGKWLNAVYSE